MLFETDFENNPALSLFGNAMIQGIDVIAGLASLKCLSAYSGIEISFPSQNELYIRFKMKFLEYPASNAYIVKTKDANGNDLAWLGLIPSDRGWKLMFGVPTSAYGSTYLQPNTTYDVILSMKQTATENIYTVKVNGIEDMILHASLTAGIGIVQLGSLWIVAGSTWNFLLDDIAIDNMPPTEHPIEVSTPNLTPYGYVWLIDFSKEGDALFPKPNPDQNIIQTYPFQTEQSWNATSNPKKTVERLLTPTERYVLRIAYVDALTEDDARVHIRHLWNPLATDINIEAIFEFPAPFNIDGWTEILAPISERIYGSNGNTALSFALALSLIGPGDINRTYTPTGNCLQFLTNFPMIPNQGQTRFLRTHQGIDITQITTLKVHVHRPVFAADPTGENAGGYLELWINNIPATWYDKDSKEEFGSTVMIRTCGAKPQEILALPTTVIAAPDLARGWVEGGVDLYSDCPPNGSAYKEIFVHQVILEQETLSPVTVNLQIYVPQNGSTNPTGIINVTQNENVIVTATPNTGYSFKNWLLDGVDAGSANPSLIIADANHTLEAIFEQTTTPPVTHPCALASATEGTVFMVYLPSVRRFRDRCLSKDLQNVYYLVSKYLAPKIKKLRGR